MQMPPEPESVDSLLVGVGVEADRKIIQTTRAVIGKSSQ
jgi:hypothetical protein